MPEAGADVRIRDLPNAAAVAAAVAERFDGGPTVVMLDAPDALTTRALLEAGARGVIARDAGPADVEAVVAAVARGFVVLARGVERGARTADEGLTRREREVLDLVARGLSNKAIAARLTLTENTVKFHVASILDKLDATTRAQAVTIGVRRGWVMV